VAIQTIKIHPAIGIARLGNSGEFFIGPELVGDRTPPAGGYKDAQCRLKRQAARFRLFGYDQNGVLVQEITAADAAIVWTVHLANTKAAGPKFYPAIPPPPPPPLPLRNQGVADRNSLKIDPGPRSLSAPNQIVGFNSGTFLGFQVPLGDMRTDADGRLLVLGGAGQSSSPTNSPLTYWAENDGWHDDVSDGPVTASVTLNGMANPIVASGAWVICAPPKFAPSIQDIITLYDVLYELAVEKGWIVPPAVPSFNNDIFPLLDRASKMKWLSGLAASMSAHDTFPAIIPPPGSDAVRAAISARHRDPTSAVMPPDPVRNMPYIWGDDFKFNAALTKTQFANMAKWAANNFVNDWGGAPPSPQTIITPEGLDQAALENCVGAAFYPGIETSWKTRDVYPYVEPFRLDGTQVQAGDLTQQMAVPWQTDFLDCSDGDTPFLWWPAHRPTQVWPEDGSPQVDWTRDLVSNWQDMIDNAFRLGLIVERGGQFMETERDVVCKTCTFVMNRSTLGQDEIDARGGVAPRALPATIPDVFRVVVDGFAASDLGITDSTGQLPVVSTTNGLSFNCTGNTSDSGSYGPGPQRFTFDYTADFGLTDVVFGFTDTLMVPLSVSVGPASASAQLELIKQPNPFILHGDPAWLSVDLRTFVVRAGDSKFGVSMGADASAAPGFIRQVMTALTAGQGSAGGQTFEHDLSTGEEASALPVLPTDGSGNKVFGFAVARVRYIGTIGASNVRVFFRLFQAQTTSTTFDPSTTYRRTSTNPSGQPISLPGILGPEYVTIPFFAETRIDSTLIGMDQQTDDANRQDIPPMGSAESDHYFGCWLDINQPMRLDGTPNNVLPVNGSAAFPNGPFNDPQNPPLPIQQAILRNHHQCLVAEIAFDPIAIPVGKDPSNWDKLAQRNLAWSDIPNPGVDGSRRAVSTFEIRPSLKPLWPGQPVDELMIDWKGLPGGARGNIYLPAISINDVLTLAGRMYSTHRLTRVDDHTLQCPASGITYVPLPRGSHVNYAGLLTVDLPLGVRRGQVFNVVVRQVTSAAGAGRPPQVGVQERAAAVSVQYRIEWRRVLGAFQLAIPVSTKGALLIPEERLLSVLRWIAEAIPATSRWYPVFQRYLAVIAGRVDGFGGSSIGVLPSPTGDGGPHGHGLDTDDERVVVTGKIVELLFDRFGDFEGFVVDDECGHHRYTGRERNMELLARQAWQARLRISVHATREQPHRPTSIVVHEPPVSFSE
jgi:hypothetical protein